MWAIGGKRRIRAALALAGVGALAALIAPATAQATDHRPAGHRFTLPPGTPAPDGDYRVLSAYRVVRGVQIYTCDPAGTWNPASTPEATLARYGRHGRIHHYGGPRWTSKRDGSTLLGAVAKRVPKDGTIPWLLLTATRESGGPGTELYAVTHISRVNTSGGLAPTGACTPGEKRAVRYGADYVFWVPKS
ncbi:DUF3455 domain-containing protein [Cryptosporangium aurantiacum]|uniref:DUF3455 domain-containing protein n=1 Tax=Cryptosporangium aurantiacum TaxID=134849 RepID=A0A1M7RB63_9ACTN|nr:DUF3455 domain-containing protein [Cryptosporangium aurantiacum]SHN43410.1 Protein of unknown function [Cryptosporangium aurantiacum]